MPREIIPTESFIKNLEKQYPGLKLDIGLLKPWFAKSLQLFFDCGKTENKGACLKKLLGRKDLEQFSVISVVKEEQATGQTTYTLNQSRFCRVGQERPEDFIHRYNKNLKEPVTLSMQLFNMQPVELVGFSYVSPEERAELMEDIRRAT